MPVYWSTYYGLVRIKDMGPEARAWAVTDKNFEIISLLNKSIGDLHVHSGATPLQYPGYNYATPATPLLPRVTEHVDEGSLSPGAVIGTRLSFVDGVGLETNAGPEQSIILEGVPERPTALGAAAGAVATPVPGAIPGGTYIYAQTKRKNTGETEISEPSIISVPFHSTSTHYVDLNFDAINSYTDGTDSIRIYRAKGFDTNFKLLKTVTDTSTTSYRDDNTVEDEEAQPPITNTFDRSKLVRIDWGGLATPAEAEKMRVYVTQETGVWGTNHLLQEYNLKDLSTPVPYFYDYKGDEVLSEGWPQETTQIPQSPSKIHLRTETYGGFNLTEFSNSAGYQALNFRLGTPVPTASSAHGGLGGVVIPDGTTYYDPSIPAARMRVGGVWVTYATPGGSPGYVHPAQEQGGHAASGIVYGSQNINSVANIIANSSAGQIRKKVQPFYKAIATTNSPTTNSTVPVLMPQMELNVVADFAGQWLEITGNAGDLHHNAENVWGAIRIDIDNIGLDTTVAVATFHSNSTDRRHNLTSYFATPISRQQANIKLMWWTQGGTLSNVLLRRQLTAKLVF